MPTLYILRGIPGSGKSTYRTSTGLAYVNRDELREQNKGATDTKIRAIIVDLDGTLCDITHRREHVLQKPKNWKAFFAGICDDTPNLAVLDIIQLYAGDPFTRILLVSGRGEEYRAETEAWLLKHRVDYHWLLMRPFNNRDDDTIIKENIYETYIKPYFNVLFCVDDRPRICRMWREKGLTCFQIQEEEF